jgi:DUF2075 family protein
MRVSAGDDYVGYVRQILSNLPPERAEFVGYDLRLFDDLGAMRRELRSREDEVGLARLVAGFAWPWKSRKNPAVFDIQIDGEELRWNSTDKDWVGSAKSVNEVGSIHTIQGYDLNYAGVIIGPDLRFDPTRSALAFDRSNYFDKRGKQDNRKRKITYTDDDLLRLASNIYAVLLTRGILGTYVFVCDQPLREYLRTFLSQTQGKP